MPRQPQSPAAQPLELKGGSWLAGWPSWSGSQPLARRRPRLSQFRQARLDTNVAIRILNQQVDLAAFRQAGGQAFLCLTVVGELDFGADRSANVVANRARVDQLIADLVPSLLWKIQSGCDMIKRLSSNGA